MSEKKSAAPILSVLVLGNLLAAGLGRTAQAQTPGREAARPVWAGVVTSLRGTATATPPGGTAAPLTGIDWIPDGAVVATGEASELSLALRDGTRFRLGARARATVTASGLSGRSGPVEAAGAVSPIPEVAPLVRPVPGQLGAVRIRSAVLKGLYPAAPYTSLADSTTLAFEKPAGAEVRVEIEDEAGETVFETRTLAGTLRLPAGILRPGERYFWRVRTVGKGGPAAHGEAEFETLSPEAEKARARLAATVRPDDASALALAAEVDRQLGLLREAREGFTRVAALAPGNEGVSRALAALAADEKALSTAP